MTATPSQPARPDDRRGWLQGLLGIAIGLGGLAAVQGIGLATAFIAAMIHPTWELDVLVPAAFAMVIADGLFLVTMVVVGIRHIRRGRRPLGIGLLAIPLLQLLLLVGWVAHLAAR